MLNAKKRGTLIMSLEIKTNICLKNYTTWRVGGAAEYFAIVKTPQELLQALEFNKKITLLGAGSNVLISDNGIKGLVIKNRMHKVVESGGFIIAESGTALPLLANYYYLSGFGDLYWAHSIPGTLGGALKSNAGAHGGTIGDLVQSVEVLRDGKKITLTKSDCGFSYRNSKFLDSDIILNATLSYKKTPQELTAQKRKEAIEYRKLTQPTGFSAGSTFKSVPSPNCSKLISAGFYIDKAGLKGKRVGGAVVSEKHANFILNDSSATASDILELITTIKLKVYKMFGIVLAEEIKYLG